MLEFQYFEGCPNVTITLKNLKELVREGIIPEKEVKIIRVESPEEAEKVLFQGSPTILVDSIDIYTGQPPCGSNYSCRTYTFGETRTGVLHKDFIKKRYLELKAGV